MSEERSPSFWSVIPDTVLSNRDLKPNAKLLYAKVTSLQTRMGYCYASNSYLADGLGIAPDTVTRLLKCLSDAGYLRLEIIRDQAGMITERRIFPVIPSSPIGQTSDTLSDKHPIPIGQTSDTLSDKHPTKSKVESKEENPPLNPPAGVTVRKTRNLKKAPCCNPERFARFWDYYPRGENKAQAIRAWDNLAPSDELCDEMAKALKRQKESDDWKRGIGIPYAATWLNQRRWEDEIRADRDLPLPPVFDPTGGLPRC